MRFPLLSSQWSIVLACALLFDLFFFPLSLVRLIRRAIRMAPKMMCVWVGIEPVFLQGGFAKKAIFLFSSFCFLHLCHLTLLQISLLYSEKAEYNLIIINHPTLRAVHIHKQLRTLSCICTFKGKLSWNMILHLFGIVSYLCCCKVDMTSSSFLPSPRSINRHHLASTNQERLTFS